jgi:hypothetical protein
MRENDRVNTLVGLQYMIVPEVHSMDDLRERGSTIAGEAADAARPRR